MADDELDLVIARVLRAQQAAAAAAAERDRAERELTRRAWAREAFPWAAAAASGAVLGAVTRLAVPKSRLRVAPAAAALVAVSYVYDLGYGGKSARVAAIAAELRGPPPPATRL